MTYATAIQLLARFDAEEIAQRTAREVPRLVTAAMLITAAAAGSMAGYTADEIAATNAALAIVNRSLGDANATIDSYVSARYTLPLAPVPAQLERLACDLARFYLFDDQATEQVTQRHDKAVAFLRDVANGKAALGADSATGVQPVDSEGAQLVTAGRVWQRDSSTGFI